MIKNAAVRNAYLKHKQEEDLVAEQKTADRRIYWYVLVLAFACLFHVAEPWPWVEAQPVLLSWMDWVKSWL